MIIEIHICGVMIMLNYLLDLDISPEEIYDINHGLSKEIVSSLELSKNIVKDTITYYKELGVEKISDLIINRPDLVLIDRKNIESIISKIDTKLFVSIVNNDIEDLILFGV